jgi:hypothetical protein
MSAPRKPVDDPRSPEYARAYERGWRAENRSGGNEDRSGLNATQRADQRDEPNAWYDGQSDAEAWRAKWTWRDARIAGFGRVEDYL